MTINLATIKTNFKSILDAANTTTASHYLSTGMTTKVARVLKVNPARIAPQASFIPWVTIYVDNKKVEHATIAVNQQNAKRKAEVNFKVVGAVWESTLTDTNTDDADENVEKLLENVEEIVRRNQNLNNTVLYTSSEGVSYHTLQLDEQTHFRVGILDLKATVYY